MRKFDLSLRSSRSSYFATFRHQLTILSKTDALDEEKWLNMLGTFVRSEERFSRNAETDLVCRLLLEKKKKKKEERRSDRQEQPGGHKAQCVAANESAEQHEVRAV